MNNDAIFYYAALRLWDEGNYKAVNRLYSQRFRENCEKAQDVQNRLVAALGAQKSSPGSPSELFIE